MAERRIRIQTIVNFQDGEVTAIEGTATIGEQRLEFVLNDQTREAAFDIDQPEGVVVPVKFSYRVHLRQHFPSAQRSSFESPVMTSEASIFLINPRELYKLVPVSALAVFDFERYRHALVDVKAEATGGWSHTQTMRLGKEVPEREVRFLVDATAEVTLQRRYRYVTPAGDVVEQAWEPAGEGMMAVGNPPAAGPGIG